MSTSASERARSVLPSPPVPLSRPRLTIVPASARSRRRLPFVVLVISVLAAGLVGLLLLNTSMERRAYQITALRDQSSALSARQQSLVLQVAALQDPQEVAQKALQLGMVQNENPAFLSLATGKVLGHSVPGLPGDQFDIGTKIGPSVDRLGKIAPIVGGEANGAGGPVVLPKVGGDMPHGGAGGATTVPGKGKQGLTGGGSPPTKR
jgi:cell division protein FtsB